MTVEWTGAMVRITAIDGEFRLQICREGGVRLFDPTGRAQLFQNRPNPFNAETDIDYEVIERGHTSLTVNDLLGRRVALLVDAVLEPGRYRVHYDASSLPSGVYVYMLTTETITASRVLSVAR